METTFSIQRRVEFAETDMAGIAHFTNYFRYMEEAEHAFLRARGLSVVLDDERGKLGFPKLSAQCNYKRPARYEELVDIDMHVSSNDGKTVNYRCEISSQGLPIATGTLQVAFCRFPPDKPPYPIPITDEVLQKLFCLD
jgi:4-hydroxybenzoyl-CoA thioesterase/acyl-CoA thioester hydrolase